MAFNFDHTSNGDLTFKGAHVAFTGDFIFPAPLQARDYHVLMTDNAGFGIDAIANLSQELDGKVNTVDLGSAAYLNADNSQLPILVDDGNGVGVISDSIIPASILNTQHTVQYSGGLEYLAAYKGDVATVVSSAQTYILTGSNKATDWVPLESDPPVVTSVQGQTGDVSINASQISGCINSVSDSVENFLNCIDTSKANNSDLDNLVTSSCLSDSIAACCFITTSDINNSLGTNYLTNECYTNDLSFYENSKSCYIDSQLGNFVANSSIEGKAGSTSYAPVDSPNGTLVKVNEEGKLDACRFGDIAFNTTFSVQSEVALGDLVAKAGDFAIGTSSLAGKSWIRDNNNTWQPLKLGDGLYFINGVNAGVNGSISITTNDIPLDKDIDPTTVSCKIETIYCKTADVYDSYQSECSFSSCLSDNYITVDNFTQCLNNKSDNGHTHLISDINNLETCLNGFPPSPFVTGGCYSAANDPCATLAGGIQNAVFGQGGSDIGYNYAVVHAAGSADAQTIEFKVKNNSSNYLGDIALSCGLDLVSADVVAYDSFGNHVSYRAEGLFSTSAGITSAIGETAVTTFAENVGGNPSNAILVPTSNCVQICVDSQHGTFDYALANVTLVHVH